MTTRIAGVVSVALLIALKASLLAEAPLRRVCGREAESKVLAGARHLQGHETRTDPPSTVDGMTVGLPRFREVTVTSGLKMGYQMVLADLNGDGRKDIIALDERSTALAWFENPGWKRWVLADNVARPINAAACDIDSDGKPEIALVHGFETNPERSDGVVLLLKSGPDVRQPWRLSEIDRVPTAHRVRWIRTPAGQMGLLVAPLVGLQARSPDYADSVPIYLYRPGEWKRTLLTKEPLGILHSIEPTVFDAEGEQLLTASFNGIDLYRPAKGGNWEREVIAKGDPRPCPQCGTSEIKTGRVGATRFIAAIEPWHGNQLVVYLKDGTSWKRTVIEHGMVNGHALAVGDLDGDGDDEIVAGFRGKGYQLYIFTAKDPGGLKWPRLILDPGAIAAADCKIGDLNSDGLPDIACIGASTGNVKIYENQGLPRGSFGDTKLNSFAYGE